MYLCVHTLGIANLASVPVPKLVQPKHLYAFKCLNPSMTHIGHPPAYAQPNYFLGKLTVHMGVRVGLDVSSLLHRCF
jgi:hypothetical protein